MAKPKIRFKGYTDDCLKHLNAPCILYNLNGYYDSLKQLLEHMIEMDLSSREKQEGIYFAENLEKIQKCLAK